LGEIIKVNCLVCGSVFEKNTSNTQKKYCSSECREKKYCLDLETFRKDRRENYHKNKEKILKYEKIWRNKNIERVRQIARIWRNKNRDKIKKSRIKNREKDKITEKIYREKNRDRLNELAKNWDRNKKKTTINYKLRCVLRSRISKFFKRVKKSKKTSELIGCEYETVRLHIEKQFKDGMTWENHGTHGWHIDHIIPCASFDLTDPEQQKKCFHYTNIQPLWASENLSKGAKIL
jgi:endogenous inhibitor of DNA gyrase (YacG/DUF329 family)